MCGGVGGEEVFGLGVENGWVRVCLSRRLKNLWGSVSQRDLIRMIKNGNTFRTCISFRGDCLDLLPTLKLILFNL